MATPFRVIKFVWNHPANRRRRVRSVIRAVRWQISKRTSSRAWTIKVYNGLKMKCYPDSRGASFLVYTSGRQDPDDFSFIEAYLRPGDRFLDVGANIGIYTLLAAGLVGKTGRVDALEPGLKAYKRLEENIALNQLSQVHARHAAANDSVEPIPFLQGQDLTNRIATGEGEADGEVAVVPSVLLDDILGQGPYAMAKIDVEGAEPICFRGAVKSLAAGNPPVWFIELKDRLLRQYGFDVKSFVAFLQDSGYDIGLYEHQGRGLYFPEVWQGEAENAIAVHRDAREHVLARLSGAES